jgi:hypothetical protein
VSKLLSLFGDEVLPISQDFSANSSLGSWVIPGSAAVVGGVLVITPTRGTEILTDPGLEGTYTAGLNGQFNSTSGSPTVSQSADVHGGAKAQAFQAAASGNRIGFAGSVTADRWYLATEWMKRVSGTAYTCQMSLYVDGAYRGGGNPVGADANNYTKLAIARLSVGTTLAIRNCHEYGASFDAVIIDDLSFTQLTFASMFALRKTAPYGIHRATFTTQGGRGSTPGGVAMCWDNPANPQSGLLALHDRTNTGVLFYKYVNGAPTLVTSGAGAYTAGAPIEIRRARGTNTFQVFYNNAQIGVDQTINDAEIINNQYGGLFSTYEANTFSGFFS